MESLHGGLVLQQVMPHCFHSHRGGIGSSNNIRASPRCRGPRKTLEYLMSLYNHLKAYQGGTEALRIWMSRNRERKYLL